MSLHAAPAVCALVVAYGDHQGVVKCVASLRACTFVSEILVVDNGGDLALAEVCDSMGTAYLDPGANLGYGRGVNLAGKSVRGDFSHVLVVNPDLVLHDLAPVLGALTLSGAAIATGCLLRQDGSIEANTRAAATPKRELSCAVVGTRAYSSPTPNLDDHIERVPQAAGSLLLMTGETWMALGGFDERFELYYEDVDLCRRAADLGGVVRARTAVAHHFGGASYGENRSQAYVALRVSRHRYLRKWYGAPGAALAIFLTLLEVVSRGLSGQAEGWRTRGQAVAAQLAEFRAPGSVTSLSRYAAAQLPDSPGG